MIPKKNKKVFGLEEAGKSSEWSVFALRCQSDRLALPVIEPSTHKSWEKSMCKYFCEGQVAGQAQRRAMEILGPHFSSMGGTP